MTFDAHAAVLSDADGNVLFGQATMAASLPVVLASNQSAIATTNANIDVALSTRASESTLATISGKLPASVGQKTMANSFAVVIASDQSAVPVSGTVTATIASVGLTGAVVPTSADYAGFIDASGNLQGAHVFDLDSSGGTQWIMGVSLRRSSAGGGAEIIGGNTMNNSIPVTMASNQTAFAVNPNVRYAELVLNQMRGDGIGSQRHTSEVLLWHDAIEGGTVNAFWTQSTTTMTIAQASSRISLNSAASTAANGFAIITSQRQFPLYPRNALWCRFRALVNTNLAGNHELAEIGLGAPVGTTAIISNGAFFRWKADGSLVAVSSFGGTETVSATLLAVGVISTVNYYNYDIVLLGDYVRFIISDSNGGPVVDTTLRTGLTTQSAMSVSHTPSFARVYADATGGGSAVQWNIGAHSVQLLDGQMAATLDDQMAMAMRHASINPTTYAQNTQLATGAAPAAFNPSNTVAGNAFLGGEAQVNSTATNENLLSIFAFTVPSPYTFMLRGIHIPRPIITTALAATACILEVFVIANCATGNISTGGGQRISLGLFRAAASAAAATALDGSDIVFGRQTPIACLPGTVLHIGWKMILGAATGVIRFVAAVDGYFV